MKCVLLVHQLYRGYFFTHCFQNMSIKNSYRGWEREKRSETIRSPECSMKAPKTAFAVWGRVPSRYNERFLKLNMNAFENRREVFLKDLLKTFWCHCIGKENQTNNSYWYNRISCLNCATFEPHYRYNTMFPLQIHVLTCMLSCQTVTPEGSIGGGGDTSSRANRAPRQHNYVPASSVFVNIFCLHWSNHFDWPFNLHGLQQILPESMLPLAECCHKDYPTLGLNI
jgi:hypothetical protein